MASHTVDTRSGVGTTINGDDSAAQHHRAVRHHAGAKGQTSPVAGAPAASRGGYADDAAADLAGDSVYTLATTPLRWFVLAVYVSFGITNQFQFTMFANIVHEVRTAFHTTSFAINILFIAFAIVFILFCFPACDLINYIGLKRALVVGCSLNAAAAVLKVIAAAFYPEYVLIAAAQFACGFAQLFLLGTPPLLAAVWFPADERAVATALGSLSTFLGMAMGFIVSPLVIDRDHHGTARFVYLFGGWCVAALVTLGAVVWFVPEEPHAPPSHSSPTLRKKSSPSSFSTATRLLPFSPTATARTVWRTLRSNPSFRWLCISVGGVTGVLTGVAGVLAQFTTPFGISERDSGWITSVGILAGSLTCVVVGPIVDATHRYRLVINVLQAGVVLCFAACIAISFTPLHTADGSSVSPDSALGRGLTYGLGAAIVLECMFVLPAIPTAMELGVELTYPHVDEVIPATAIMASQAVVQVVATVGLSILIGNTATQLDAQIALGAAGAVVLGFVVSFTVGVKEDLHRQRHEESAGLLARRGDDAEDREVSANDTEDRVRVVVYTTSEPE